MTQAETWLAQLAGAGQIIALDLVFIALVVTLWRAVRGPQRESQALAFFQSWLCLMAALSILSVRHSSEDLMEAVLGLALVLPFTALLVTLRPVLSTRGNRPQGETGAAEDGDE